MEKSGTTTSPVFPDLFRDLGLPKDLSLFRGLYKQHAHTDQVPRLRGDDGEVKGMTKKWMGDGEKRDDNLPRLPGLVPGPWLA